MKFKMTESQAERVVEHALYLYEHFIMNCPCCDGKLTYSPIKNESTTHVWMCDTCPIVMLELYDSSNIEALKKLL